ncbi:MAG TPA: glycine--tRNA ligase subunit beta, partial [Miltoncostaeaceae bacterium]|nr:glycine--tRNA ligase subunit beta [Miltoncostaeaceae bacterium]
MPDLLLEVGCEELPSSACREIIDQAPGLVRAALDAAGLGGAGVRVSVAPRRFAVRVRDLPAELPATSRTVRGPAAAAAFGPDGAPTRAAEGFARGQGVAVGDLVVREDNGREFVFAELRSEGRAVGDVVPDLAARLVNGLRFSKTMRWGDGTGLRFSRPVRWIVAKLDERTVPFELHGLRAGDVSQGHRFLGAPATIGDPSAYEPALNAVGVVPDHDARRAQIVGGLDEAAAGAGGTWSDPGGKLEEVVFLVEWPSVITGRFDPRHLRLPSRVLVTAMQGHQRYFPLRDGAGDLLPAFLAVSNGDPAHADVITRGNEDVLDARLQDAEFSFDRDLEAGLQALDARLDAIVLHKRLGTMAQKRDRLVAGVADLADAVGADAAVRGAAEHAARLAKADQGAVLVAEFSELEGYVAAEYARREGVPQEVATAVEEHYLPEGPDSPLPSGDVGALVAAAEKIDNLVGAFAV